ncbi:MAG: phosphatidate cytidylyltransferase, partial [Solirubrobacteraceae bacterium]
GAGPRRAQRERAARDGRRTAGRRSDLPARILIAIPAAIVAIVFVDIGGTAWALFMIAICWICMNELYRLLARWKPAPAVGFAAAVALVLAARFGTERTVLEVTVIALPVAFLAVVGRGPGNGMATVSIAGTLFGVYWLGLAFAHAMLLRGLNHGGGIMIDVLVGTFLADTAAYLGGRMFGRRPLAPSISPHKTVEGLICGMIVAIVSLFIAGLNQPWMHQGNALLLGLVIAVLGPVGDLFESVVKREAGAKDSGRLFRAHGGALDRLDAVIFTVVAAYYVAVGFLH